MWSPAGSTCASAGGYAAALSVVTVCGLTPVLFQGGAKESSRCFRSAVLPEQPLHDLPVRVEGAIHLAPPSRPFAVGRIDRPALAHPGPVCFRRLLLQRSKLPYPIEHGGCIHRNRSCGPPLDHLGIAEPKAQIPAHGSANHHRRTRMTRKRRAGPSSERPVAVRAALDWCAAPITTIVDNVFSFTTGTAATRFLFAGAAHYLQHTLSLQSPTKPSVASLDFSRGQLTSARPAPNPRSS